MKSKSCLAAVGLFFIVVMIGYARSVDFLALKGPYLGQKPPGLIPEIFAPGLISTNLSQSYIAFLDGARVCVFSVSTDRGHETYYTYERDGRWTKPERAPFEELQGHPNYTTGPLGRRVYYHSGNPTHAEDTRLDDNIWTIQWTGSGWAEPEALPEPVNSEYGEAYPSAAGDGTVYFFTWRREGTRGYDIWFSRRNRGKYREAERLPWPINTDFIEYDPYIAPDESFLIFGSDRPGGFGKSDNYICFRREDGSWTSPMNLGRPYNSSSFDLCANGTPDGKYFFFTSGRKTEADKGEIGLKPGTKPEEDADLYWVDFTFMHDLKNTLFTKQNAAIIIKEDYGENGIRSAVDTMNRLYDDHKNSVYFLPFELLSLAKDMMIGGEIKDADLFCAALEKMLPKDLSIKEGYARICAMNGFVPKGMKIFEDLDKEDPNFDLNDALSPLGYLFTLYPEKTQDALSVLRFTVEKFPEDPWAFYGLARVYRRLGDLDKAIENCRKSLELSPEVGDISQLLERLLEEKKRKKERDQPFPFLQGPYLGQNPPGENPELFMFGWISTPAVEYCISFLDKGRVCVFGREDVGVNYTCLKDGRWTKPRKMPLDPSNWEWKHNAGPDDKTLYLMSRRPVDADDTKKDADIYLMKWTGSGWTGPEILPFPPNSEDYHEVYPSAASDGTVYFHGGDFRHPHEKNDDIYRSRCVDGVYQEQERLPEPINTEYGEYDAFVAPNEEFLMFGSDRPGGFGGYDSFISFKKKNGTWTNPVNLGRKLNSVSWENRVMLTPDGRYIFFVSGRRHVFLNDELANGKRTSATGIYWVDSSLIEKLKLKMLGSEEAAEIVSEEYNENGIEAAIAELSRLKQGRGNSCHFSPCELLMLCRKMMEAGRVDDADRFYQALLDTLNEDYRIKRGYGMIRVLHGRVKNGMELLSEAMSDHPVERMVTIYELGSDLLLKSRVEDALKVMRFNEKEFPGHYISHFGLAMVFAKSGETEKALTHLERALELNPDFVAAAEMLHKLK